MKTRGQVLAALGAVVATLMATHADAKLAFDGRGPHAVGYRIADYTTESVTSGEDRVLTTHIWYPADPDTGTPQGEALRDADVLSGRWPLILFSHGSCGIPNQSPFYTEALASWGFVVAAPSHPGNTLFELPECSAPSNLAESFANRPSDIRFITDTLLAASRSDRASPFYRRIDGEKIGVSGHSFGGQTTLRVADTDPRIDGAVALAPAVRLPGVEISTPTMVIGAELDSLTPFETDSREAYSLLRGPRFLVEFLDTGHCAFAITCGPSLCGTGCPPDGLDLATTHGLTLRYAVPFFLHYVAKSGRYTDELLPRNAPEHVLVVAAVPAATTASARRPLPALRSVR